MTSFHNIEPLLSSTNTAHNVNWNTDRNVFFNADPTLHFRTPAPPYQVPSSIGTRTQSLSSITGSYESSRQEPSSAGARDYTYKTLAGTNASPHQVLSSDGARDNTFNILTETRELDWQKYQRTLPEKKHSQGQRPALSPHQNLKMEFGPRVPPEENNNNVFFLNQETKNILNSTMGADLGMGASSPYYRQRGPGEVSSSLTMHGANIAPPGWTCCFSRSEERNYYCRDSDGYIQWEYPVTSYTDIQLHNALPLPDTKPKVEIKSRPLSPPPVAPPFPAAYTGSAWLERMPSPSKWYAPRPRDCSNFPPLSTPARPLLPLSHTRNASLGRTQKPFYNYPTPLRPSIDVKPPLPLSTPARPPLPPAHTRSASFGRTQKPFYNNPTPLPHSIEIKPLLHLSTTPISPQLPPALKRNDSVEPTDTISPETMAAVQHTSWMNKLFLTAFHNHLFQSEVQLPPSPSPSPSNPPLPPTLATDIKLNAHPSQPSAWYGLPTLPLSVDINPPLPKWYMPPPSNWEQLPPIYLPDEVNPPLPQSPIAASPPLPPAFTWYLPPTHECEELAPLPHSDEMNQQPPSPATTSLPTKRRREDIEREVKNENYIKMRKLARKN